MSRTKIVARTVSVTGVLLLIVAAIHLAVTPILQKEILDRTLTPQQLSIVQPTFLLNHLVVGILLIPIGFITIYSAPALRAGERWAWIVNFANGLTILSLPIVLAQSWRTVDGDKTNWNKQDSYYEMIEHEGRLNDRQLLGR